MLDFCENTGNFMMVLEFKLSIMATQITAEDRNLIIQIAKLFLGSPYQFGGNGDLP